MPIDLDRLRTGGAYDGPLAQNVLPSAAAARELAAGERVGPFRIERELSRGGMGVVYLAQRDDGEFAQRVALKWMAGARDREVAEALFRRERDIVASLEHPGIARLIDGGREADDMLWFAMEYVEGQPIDIWCEERLLSPARRVALVVELCEALAFAHQRLLIHRDIKPNNVLVGADGRVKLLDFGIARLADQRDLLGGRALTPGFASPEQCAGDEVTVASDVYQVGLLLARLLGVIGPLADGTHATRAGPGATMGAEPLALAPSRLAPLGRELAAIVFRATALHPSDRYASVAALSEDLLRWRERRPVLAVGGGWLYRLGCLLRRHPLVSTGSIGAVAALALLGWRVMVERDAALLEAQRARASQQFLSGLLEWATPNVNGGQPVTVDAALERGVAQLGETLLDSPRLRAEMLQMLGKVYLGRQEHSLAKPLLEAARALLVTAEPRGSALRVRNAIDLANALDMEKLRDKHALLDEAIGDARDDHELRIGAIRIKATLLYRDGELLAARETMAAALDVATRHLPAEHLELIQIRNNLAGYLGDLGEHEAALPLKRLAFETAVRTRGRAHTMSSLAASSLARTLILLGRDAEAATLIDEDGEVRARMWGESHVQYGVHRQNRARLMRRAGELDSARGELLAAIAASRAHPDIGPLVIASQLSDLCEVEMARGELAAAESALREALDPDVARTAVVKDFGGRQLLLARVLRLRDALAESAEAADTAELEMAALPPSHTRRGALALERAALADAADDAAAALSQLQLASSILRESPASAEREALREQALQTLLARDGGTLLTR